MKLSFLIDVLQTLADEQPEGTDPEVRLALQPHWPLECSIRDVAMVNLMPEELLDLIAQRDLDMTTAERLKLEARIFKLEGQEVPVVYIAEDRQIAFLPPVANERLGWARN